MKAIRKIKPGPGLALENIKTPAIAHHDVLIKIRALSICGTDLHIYDWDNWAARTIALPLTIGHEFMGEIVEVGREVSHLEVGDRVSGEGHITCGVCELCLSPKRHLCPYAKSVGIHREGGFAEFLSLPASNAILIPADIPNEIASIFDPLGNAVHTVLSCDVVGENVLVTGAGPIGLMCVAILKHLGAKEIVVTDRHDFRLTLAKQLGATEIHNITKGHLDAKDHFTVGLEMSGSPKAIQTQVRSLRPGGVLAILGIATDDIILDWDALIFKGLTLKGIYGRKMFNTWHKMLAMLESGLDVSSIITHRFQAEEFEKAFILAKKGECGKIVLHW